MPERGPDDATRVEERPRKRGRRRSWARRRHLGLLTTGIALLVLIVGVVLVVATWDSGREAFDQQVAAAASSASAAAPAVTATPTPSAASSAVPGTPTTTTVRGAITAATAVSWTVAGTNGLDYTVVVTATTKYAGKRSFGSFAVGDTVAVKGTLDQGTVTAQSVSPAAPAS